MVQTVDLNQSDHPESREIPEEARVNLGEGDELKVLSDYDPEPDLHKFRRRVGPPLE